MLSARGLNLNTLSTYEACSKYWEFCFALFLNSRVLPVPGRACAGARVGLEREEVAFLSCFLCLMIRFSLSRLTSGFLLLGTSADLPPGSSKSSGANGVLPYSHHHTVYMISSSPLAHEPWRNGIECLIPISPVIYTMLDTEQMVKKMWVDE